MTTAAAHPRLTPLLQASMWILPTTWLLFRAAAEQRVARLLALLAWTFAALGAMAKGPAGLVIPAGAVALHALSRRDPRALLRLEVLPGLVLAATMILPWYLAVWARHGRGFIDELVFRHMLGRTLDHLHDTNEGEDVGIVYFVRQLGYATFPWSGLAVTGVLGAAREDARSRRGSARALLFGATAVAFAVVSIMRTKFHHYGLIVLPGAAMLAGLAADEAIAIARRSRSPRASVVAGSLLTAAAISALVGLDLARGPARFILLLSYRYTRTWSGTAAYASVIAGLGAIAVLAIAVSASPRLRLRALAVAGASALALSAVLLDAYLPACGRDGGQREVFAAYYREHPEATEPLVAYQLNWKGENFYSGNHLAIFVTSGAPMKTYLDRRRERGARTVYFVTERGRVTTLRHELGAVASFAELTGPEVSSEFTLVRATL